MMGYHHHNLMDMYPGPAINTMDWKNTSQVRSFSGFSKYREPKRIIRVFRTHDFSGCVFLYFMISLRLSSIVHGFSGLDSST